MAVVPQTFLDIATVVSYIRSMSNEAMARRATKKTANAEWAARLAGIHSTNLAIVATGKCPDCGAKLHRNSSLAGWWQCDRSGSGHFRRDQTGAHCDFQCFTE